MMIFGMKLQMTMMTIKSQEFQIKSQHVGFALAPANQRNRSVSAKIPTTTKQTEKCDPNCLWILFGRYLTEIAIHHNILASHLA